ncbi:MAG TPA: NAD-dependent epimerase/dehydratase family protein [Saprospiraceae bacterium]|nr:NAD-dependent epimerase/dehydratase family protein [Saprospiraceae bacterium]HQW55879.1 NAD-dependent epimerase/dehydratase family protein [Saprospiraceae bacterium]
MGVHLVSGGCGFVGRNMVKRLYKTTQDQIFFIDDLSVGTAPETWLREPLVDDLNGIQVYGEDRRLFFLKEDFRNVVHALANDPEAIRKKYGPDFVNFKDVYHFAAIVGGRAKIDGDPMMVALDLSIDAEFFYYITRHKPERVLYPSSSAAYPVDLQTVDGAIALKESDIDFTKMGQPDMTYGWTKLTGEYLAKIAAQYYGVHITCIRPFSGYGEDQDLTYPIPMLAKRAAMKENPFEVWGSGKQGRDFVHIDDVIDCIQLAMDKISDGTAINIGMGKLTSFLDIIEVMTKFAGYQPEIKPLLDKPVGVHSRYCDMTFVEQTLGWKARISVEEGMRRVYEAALSKYQ